MGNYLFIRDTRMVQLTEAGRCFLRYAKQFMDLYNEAMVVVESTATGKRGAVHVGLSHFGAGDLLPILAVKLKEQYPDLNTATTDGPQQELMGALIDSKIDVLFTNDRALDYKTSGLSHIPLYNIPLMVFTSPEHPFTKYDRPITIDDMKNENILTMEPTAYDSPPLSQLRVPPERRSRCIPSQVRILSMIENGEGIVPQTLEGVYIRFPSATWRFPTFTCQISRILALFPFPDIASPIFSKRQGNFRICPHLPS